MKENMFYFSTNNHGDWFNLKIKPIPKNDCLKNYANCVTFGIDKLNAASCLLASLRQMLWATWTKTRIKNAGVYWWVTTENKSWLKTIAVKNDTIREEKDCWNIPYNYFASEYEAEHLKENIKKLFEVYGFPL